MKVQKGILFSMCLCDVLQTLLQQNRSSGRKLKKKNNYLTFTESVLKAHNKLAFTQGQLFIIAFYSSLLICKDQVTPRRQRLPQYPLNCQQRGLESLFNGEGNTTRGLWPKKLTSFQIVTGGSNLKNAHLCLRAESKTTGQPLYHK